MARLIFRRDFGYAGLLTDIVIRIDGAPRANVGQSARVDLTVPARRYSVEAWARNSRSGPIDIDVADHDEVRFECGLSNFFRPAAFLRKVAQTTFQQRFKHRSVDQSARWGRSPDGALEADIQWSRVLGVSTDASAQEIRNAYLYLIKMYHPDSAFSLAKDVREIAECKAREINVAYSTALRQQRKS